LIFEPSAKLEARERRRVRLLSVFLILMTINTAIGMILLKNAGGDAWIVLGATSLALLLGYFASRTRHYRAALVIALAIPALPPLTIAFFQPPEVNLTAELMWLALPLMVAALMLTLQQTIIVAISYTIFIMSLRALGLMELKDLAPVMGFLNIITFFVIVISIIRKRDQAEIENRLIELQRAEELLSENNEQLDTVLNSVPCGILVVDEETHIIQDVNSYASNAIGARAEEIIGRECHQFICPAERGKCPVNDMGKLDDNAERVLIKTNGDFIPILKNVARVTMKGSPYLLETFIDITERKKAEEKLKETMTKLERSSSQLAATNKELETFSYSVSHDLRSPLRSIDGFSQALMEDYKEQLDETGRDYVRRLRNASQKMAELIDSILKLSRLTRSEMHHVPIDLSVLAKEIAYRLQETQPERRVKFLIDKELTANGDPQLLRVLLENLLGNAWKFTSKKPQAQIEFSVNRDNGKKAYFIRDNGAGFDMTYVDKLFGAFQRLHDAMEFPGTGIGLATVQRIVHRHGGAIWAEGVVGKGATFHFTLD